MERMRHRADFLAAAAGAKASGSAFTLQACRRDDEGPARVGFTVSKKVGKAVERNRVRRRLREMVRLAPAGRLQAGHDYVLIGRRAALKVAFDAMMKELGGALRRVHASSKSASSKSAANKSGADKSGDGTGASGALSPHRAGRSKGGGGKRQMGRQNRASQHEH